MLTLFRIPAYSPHLNPEWIWKNVKADRAGRSGITGPDQFKTLCVNALRRSQRMPHLIRRSEPRLYPGRRIIESTNQLST